METNKPTIRRSCVMNELQELEQKASREYEQLLTARKQLYQYARSKGFIPREAKILAATNRDKIDRLAKLKEKESTS